MKIFIRPPKVVALLCGLVLGTSCIADSGRMCVPNPPGIESPRLDIKGEVVLQKVELGPKGQEGFLATEYLGSANLQTSVYIKTTQGYCLIGDLGGTTSVTIDKKSTKSSLFNIAAQSVSGPYKIHRAYRFNGGEYRLIGCAVTYNNKGRRLCSKSEM